MAKENNVVVFAPGTIVTGENFDPVADIQSVDQFGFVDLRDAYVNGTIPGELAVDENSYNGVDDPASLVGRPSDVFDAIRKANYVQSAGLTEGKSATPPAAAE